MTNLYLKTQTRKIQIGATGIYFLIGFLFGLLFPIVSVLIIIELNQLPFSFAALSQAHKLTPLQWIMDLAPFIFGGVAWYFGKTQNHLREQNRRLEFLEATQTGNSQPSSGVDLKYDLDRRVVQLRTAAQVAQQATTFRDLSTLLDQTTRLISDQFGFYHVGIFLNDPANEYAVLQAANSKGGQIMLERGHRLKIGETGIVGFVASKGVPRIALDVGKDAVFFNNPDLPETRSEIALPLRVGGQIIGVLDVQSVEPSAFDENDVTTLQIIADSLASAIENARLLAETQSNLEEIRALNRQYIRHAWTELISRHGSFEYTYKPSSRREKLSTGSLPRILQVPIKLRDQAIGNLTIEAEPRGEVGVNPDEWTPEELALIEAVTSQAALALENARLIEETQRRASQEMIVADISSRVWSLTDIDAILRTTLQQLGAYLKATEGLIQLEIGE